MAFNAIVLIGEALKQDMIHLIEAAEQCGTIPSEFINLYVVQ